MAEARPPIARHLAWIVALLDAVDDVLAERPTSPAPPPWCEGRGWTQYLLQMADSSLEAAEALGPEHVLAGDPRAPASLRALAAEVREAAVLPERAAPAAAPMRLASVRKQVQIEALVALAPRGVARVVDLGAGRGHLTRRLARALGVPAVGIERRAPVVELARAIEPGPDVAFEAREIDDDLALEPDDLVVGLHACGALGDRLARAAARAGAAVLLVPCCPQKIPGDVRAPLSSRGRPLARRVLGLANLGGATEAGTTVADSAHRRAMRHALRILLDEAGVPTHPGEEARAVNRRQFRRPLEEVAARAFGALGLPPPRDAALRRAAQRAAEEQAVMRRLALPRAMLARPLELAVVLDRAAALEEGAGAPPEVLRAFPPTVSPRNVVIHRPPR
ncbi:MAG: methyltransferase [Sandaracinaceae bacterium]|nr:methyltransferase [Sandaracinaceae bacterium]